MDELQDKVPDTIHFDIGYYEKRATKCWLVNSEDIAHMYEKFK